MDDTRDGAHGSGTGDPAGAFSALDRGEYRPAVEAYRRGEAADPAEPADRLRLAEVALYLGDLARARRLVAGAGPADAGALRAPGAAGSLARRRALVAAELFFSEGDCDAAEALAAPVAEAAKEAGDAFLEMRARYDLGRSARERAEHTLALERLAVAARLAAGLGNAFYEGLITLSRAVSLAELKETAAAERRCVEAVELLSRTEDLRFRALAERTYGALLTDLGRYADAVAALERAAATATALGVGADAAAARADAARALIALGRHEEAVAQLQDVLAYERSAGGRRELPALALLARAEIGRGDLEAAGRASAEALRLADDSGSKDEALDARLLSGRVRARLGDAGAADALRAALDEASAAGSDRQRAEAMVYLAEALVDASPVESARLVAEARRVPAVGATEWLRKELEEVDRGRLAAPVHVTEDGALLVDVRLGWPNLKSARDALERFVVTRALDETGGNGAAAGRLIGETRYQMHYLKRIFERGEGRPSRAASGPDEADGGAPARGRRTASRPKRLVRRK